MYVYIIYICTGVLPSRGGKIATGCTHIDSAGAVERTIELRRWFERGKQKKTTGGPATRADRTATVSVHIKSAPITEKSSRYHVQ